MQTPGKWDMMASPIFDAVSGSHGRSDVPRRGGRAAALRSDERTRASVGEACRSAAGGRGAGWRARGPLPVAAGGHIRPADNQSRPHHTKRGSMADSLHAGAVFRAGQQDRALAVEIPIERQTMRGRSTTSQASSPRTWRHQRRHAGEGHGLSRSSRRARRRLRIAAVPAS